MTRTDPCTAKALGRLGLLALIVAAMVLIAMTPPVLNLNAADTELWYMAGWVLAPLWASLAAWRAASRCRGSARKAWHHFSAGCLLWMIGTLIWASYGWLGAALPFPSLADGAYLLTAVLFMIGMFHYSLTGSGGSRIQLTNFALAISAVLSIGFVVYVPIMAQSELDWSGALVAFSYPTMWLSILAFGLICLCLYVPARRRFPFLLILASVGAQAVADFFYGFDVLYENFAAGTFYDTYWIAGFLLMVWAAAAHRSGLGAPLRPEGRDKPRAWAEALIPALSTAAMLLAVVAAEWHHLGPSSLLLVPVVTAFAALLAIREHALFTAERSLRTKAEQSARQLAESEARLSSVLENTTDGVMVLDTQWRITFANRNAVAMMFSDRPYLGLVIWDVLNPKEDNEFYRNYCIAMEQQTPVEFEAYFAPLDVWFEAFAYPTPHDLTIFFRDVTERRRMREELVRLAQHDPLTGLANRNLFGERLQLGLQSGRRHTDLILVLIDLDGFKEVNDSIGHLAGDSVLQQFASRLTGLVRRGDTVARFGGDEFAIIQPGPIEPEGGAEVARRISDALLTPFDVQGVRITVAASIGIALAPRHGSRPDELIFNADLALYRAKMNKGAGVNYCTFEPDVDAHLHIPPLPRQAAQRATAKA